MSPFKQDKKRKFRFRQRFEFTVIERKLSEEELDEIGSQGWRLISHHEFTQGPKYTFQRKRYWNRYKHYLK